MIILYLVLLDYTKIPGEELLADVEKSLEIFLAMEDLHVAKRCADLIREVYEVARQHLRDRCGQAQTPTMDGVSAGNNANDLFTNRHDFNADMFSHSDQELMRSLFNYEGPDERRDVLASLIDPTVLEDFATGPFDFAHSLGFASGNLRDSDFE
jgi:hypothetical protein